jgi:hypothetical protein
MHIALMSIAGSITAPLPHPTPIPGSGHRLWLENVCPATVGALMLTENLPMKAAIATVLLTQCGKISDNYARIVARPTQHHRNRQRYL